MTNSVAFLYGKWHDLRDEEAQDLVEYALILAMIALGTMAAMGNLATSVSNVFTAISTTLTTAMS